MKDWVLIIAVNHSYILLICLYCIKCIHAYLVSEAGEVNLYFVWEDVLKYGLYMGNTSLIMLISNPATFVV